MKKQIQSIAVITEQPDPVIETFMQKMHEDTKELAKQNAIHLANRNQPNVIGDKLIHFIGEYKTRYEKTGAEVSRLLQPQSHLPQGKMDIGFYDDKNAKIDKEIAKNNHEIDGHKYQLGNYDPRVIFKRIKNGLILLGIIMLGDTLFNSKSFQVIGENLLFALILSIGISVGTAVYSHYTMRLLKSMKTRLHRILVIAISLILITCLFIGLAVFRSAFLASHDIHISPIYFVFINLFFFVVISFLTFHYFPTKQEAKLNAEKKKILDEIEKRKNHIKQLESEKEDNKSAKHEQTKNRIRIIFLANYSIDLIRKMYKETVEVFKSNNILFRNDHQVPDCFSEPIPEPDMEDIMLLLNKYRKP